MLRSLGGGDRGRRRRRGWRGGRPRRRLPARREGRGRRVRRGPRLRSENRSAVSEPETDGRDEDQGGTRQAGTVHLSTGDRPVGRARRPARRRHRHRSREERRAAGDDELGMLRHHDRDGRPLGEHRLHLGDVGSASQQHHGLGEQIDLRDQVADQFDRFLDHRKDDAPECFTWCSFESITAQDLAALGCRDRAGVPVHHADGQTGAPQVVQHDRPHTREPAVAVEPLEHRGEFGDQPEARDAGAPQRGIERGGLRFVTVGDTHADRCSRRREFGQRRTDRIRRGLFRDPTRDGDRPTLERGRRPRRTGCPGAHQAHESGPHRNP
ncbi:hypothetical protein EGT67_10965 [Prescottella agglutinans]|uniref:Uncharacterized protein n=1 Tax=Prescottella agglutinans TaxID=1644129 RepID=A0A438BE95_9NOCA|nr:hypothetical protein EGT67_10965 [Prescottella agglutinans]